jgi:hypothetical protein
LAEQRAAAEAEARQKAEAEARQKAAAEAAEAEAAKKEAERKAAEERLAEEEAKRREQEAKKDSAEKKGSDPFGGPTPAGGTKPMVPTLALPTKSAERGPSILNPVDVVQGRHPESVMARKLKGLTALTPASALHRVCEIEDDGSPESDLDSVVQISNLEALRTAEEGSLDRLISCRSLVKKRAVLDCALQMSNRDAVLLVVVWMRDTLKKDLFHQEMCVRPKAVHVYASYLREMHRWEELEVFYTTIRSFEVQLGKGRAQGVRSDTCAQLAYSMIRRALTKSQPEELVAALKEAGDFAGTLSQNFAELETIAEYCNVWRQLTLRQMDIERNDVPLAAQAAGLASEKVDQSNMFARFPRPCVLAASVLETMNYCSLFHASERQDHIASPKGLSRALNVSEKMYWHCAFTALARTGSWDLMRRATESTTTFSSKVVNKSPIGFRPLICLIYTYGDPRDLKDPRDELRKLAVHFAGQMEDQEDALKLCVQKRMWEGAISACVELRDEDKLVELRVTIAAQPGDNERFLEMIDEVYKDKRISWKSEVGLQGGGGGLRIPGARQIVQLLKRGMSKITGGGGSVVVKFDAGRPSMGGGFDSPSKKPQVSARGAPTHRPRARRAPARRARDRARGLLAAPVEQGSFPKQ